MQKTVTIKGVDYKVEKIITPDTARAKGCPNLADELERQGRFKLFVRRPGGYKILLAIGDMATGRLAETTPLPIF